MQEIIWLDSAVNDLVRLRQFIAIKNPTTAQKTAKIIQQATEKLSKTPNIGKPIPELLEYRDLYVKFSVAGFVIRYRIEVGNLYIVHVRHYRQYGF